jgi:hypothetical protein
MHHLDVLGRLRRVIQYEFKVLFTVSIDLTHVHVEQHIRNVPDKVCFDLIVFYILINLNLLQPTPSLMVPPLHLRHRLQELSLLEFQERTLFIV